MYIITLALTYWPAVGSEGGAPSYERGTPLFLLIPSRSRQRGEGCQPLQYISTILLLRYFLLQLRAPRTTRRREHAQTAEPARRRGSGAALAPLSRP